MMAAHSTEDRKDPASLEIERFETVAEHSGKAEKQLLRKIDLYVLPWLCVTYALSLIDRTNISAAKIAGMSKDLNLKGNEYNIALLLFFFTYILTEIPSNAIIRRLGTRYYLTFLIVCWGIIAMCFAFVNTFGQLVTLRVLLGLFEGGFNVSPDPLTFKHLLLTNSPFSQHVFMSYRPGISVMKSNKDYPFGSYSGPWSRDLQEFFPTV